MKKENFFILFSMISVFLVCGEYSITRPTSNALFLTFFSSKAYPAVWLATVPLNLFVIYLYSRYLPKIGPIKMLWLFALFTTGVNVASGLLCQKIPQVIFFQYIWKDIYILFMLKQIWSMIHSTILKEKAKYVYGAIYGIGTLGAILGSVIPSFFAQAISSEKILTFTLFPYLILLITYTLACKKSSFDPVSFEKNFLENPRPKEAFSLIRRSSILTAVLLLVVFMQVSVALMEYRFNSQLELTILEKDLRTAFCGKVLGSVNVLSLAMQFVGSLFVVRILGLRGSHFLVPILLLTSLSFSLYYPSFQALTLSYILLKAIDFSLFGVIREMLYVPLHLDAKYRAKAVIDVFAYRTSKALISLGLLSLQFFTGSYLFHLTGYISILILMGWLLTVFFLFREKQAFLKI